MSTRAGTGTGTAATVGTGIGAAITMTMTLPIDMAMLGRRQQVQRILQYRQSVGGDRTRQRRVEVALRLQLAPQEAGKEDGARLRLMMRGWSANDESQMSVKREKD